ncbi:MAG: peptidoglycan-binding domain-containing protein [Dermatophilaceae bacterium]
MRTQRALQALGYTVPISGVYDSATRDAVSRFQSNHGIVADGEAGSQTWSCIDAVNAINSAAKSP